MRFIKKFFIITIIWVFLIPVKGCLPPDEYRDTDVFQEQKETGVKIPTAPKSSEIILASVNVYGSDPLKSSDEIMTAFYSLVFKNLVELNEYQQCIPSIARSWKITDDPKIWEVTINDKIYFHDGTELSADDIIYTIDTIKNYGGQSPYLYNVNNIKSCEALDNKIYITLTKEDSSLPWKLNIPIISRKDFLQTRDDSSFLNGTGPFKVIDYNENFILIKKITDDTTVRLKSVDSYKESKEIIKPGNNSISIVPGKEGELYTKRVDLFQTEYIGNRFDFVSFNVNALLLNKPNVRKAISYFINVEEIVNQVYGENAVYADYPVHPKSFLNEWSIGAIHEYDPEKGKELMEREKFPMSGGVYQRIQQITGKDEEGNTIYYYRYYPVKFEILVNAYDSEKCMIAKLIKEQLESNGIQVTINEQSGEKIKDLIKRKSFDILISSISLNNIPDPEIIGMLYTKTGLTGSNEMYNVSNINDNVLNQLCIQAAKAGSMSDMINALNDIQYYLKDNVNYIGLCYMKKASIYSRSIIGSFGQDNFSFFRNGEYLTVN